MTEDKFIMSDREESVGWFTPYKNNNNGGVTVIFGFGIYASLEDMIEEGARVIVQVDDLDTLSNPRVIFPKRGEND